jgi:hypothetical protein
LLALKVPDTLSWSILQEVFSRFHDQDTPPRVLLAMAWVFVDADKDNLDRLLEALTACGAAGWAAP